MAEPGEAAATGWCRRDPVETRSPRPRRRNRWIVDSGNAKASARQATGIGVSWAGQRRFAELRVDAEQRANEICGGAEARAEEIIAGAHAQAGAIVRAAEAEADRIRSAAHDQADDAVFAASLERQEIADELAEIERRRAAAVRGLEQLARSLRDASG